MITVKGPEQEAPKRTPKWCKLCGRKHNLKEPCGLVDVLRIAKSGALVARRTLPKPGE